MLMVQAGTALMGITNQRQPNHPNQSINLSMSIRSLGRASKTSGRPLSVKYIVNLFQLQIHINTDILSSAMDEHKWTKEEYRAACMRAINDAMLSKDGRYINGSMTREEVAGTAFLTEYISGEGHGVSTGETRKGKRKTVHVSLMVKQGDKGVKFDKESRGTRVALENSIMSGPDESKANKKDQLPGFETYFKIGMHLFFTPDPNDKCSQVRTDEVHFKVEVSHTGATPSASSLGNETIEHLPSEASSAYPAGSFSEYQSTPDPSYYQDNQSAVNFATGALQYP